ncbi:MAG TPA: PspC domain-containing protein [Pseudonocardiaceae bacterium]
MSAELVRPREGRVIGGVCAGLADRFGLSRGVVRLAFVLSCVLPGPQFLVYLVLWVLIPDERRVAAR